MSDKENKIGQEQKEEGVETMVDHMIHNLGQIAINYFAVKRMYPKAIQKCLNFLKEKTSIEVEEEMLVASLLYGARNILYDFFDSEKIFVNISVSEEGCTYSILGKEGCKTAVTNKRAITEAMAFKAAFETLENKL